MSGTATRAELATLVVGAIRAVAGHAPAELHEPRFEGNEYAYLKECLDSTFVSSVGRFVDRFEADLAAYLGVAHAVAVVNGTAALQVALRLAGVERDDEVLMPALTFVATASAVSHAGAVPHFLEASDRTLGIDPASAGAYLRDTADVRDGICINRATGRRIRAVVPMHTFGHPVDMPALLSVAAEFGIPVVEDAAESLGTTLDGRHMGTFGALGTLSFNGNKTITTGGGGAIVTNNPDLAKRAKHLTTTAKVPHPWAFVHDEVGYNYRMPNLNAALGCAQLEQLPSLLAKKRQLTDAYAREFGAVPGARVFLEPAGARSNYWLQTLLLDDAIADQRDAVLAATHAAGYRCRPAWTLMHRLSPYASCPRMPLPVAESLERRIINLPSSPHLARGAA